MSLHLDLLRPFFSHLPLILNFLLPNCKFRILPLYFPWLYPYKKVSSLLKMKKDFIPPKMAIFATKMATMEISGSFSPWDGRPGNTQCT